MNNYDVHLLTIIFIFFFQAEDGIRDLTVTGVQTCALPISKDSSSTTTSSSQLPNQLATLRFDEPTRSEERRVGKSVDLGGRRIIKKKIFLKKNTKYENLMNNVRIL